VGGAPVREKWQYAQSHPEVEMSHPTFGEYEAAARREGYDEVVERSWKAGATVPLHDHPFAVKALLVAGEMWLTEGELTRHLGPGDGFELAALAPHAERYGEAGATYWAARRHPH
jgi:quercetin dioxygenase-like cupin family protein